MPELRSCRKSLWPVVWRKYPKNLLQTKYLNQKQSADKDLTARLVGVPLVCRFKNKGKGVGCLLPSSCL